MNLRLGSGNYAPYKLVLELTQLAIVLNNPPYRILQSTPIGTCTFLMARIHSCLACWSSALNWKGFPVWPQITRNWHFRLPVSGILCTSVLPFSTS